MNGWLAVACLLVAEIGLCGLLAARRSLADGLVALELAGTLGTLALLVIAEGLHRQPFGDLAVVSAATTLVGAMAFARVLERGG